MARETSNFFVGLFVTAGSLLVVMAVVWIGATRYFDKGTFYISYFNESVQGLQKDSEVKFRGVTVGRVEAIRIAPDNKLIGVVMSINARDDLTKNAVAQLQITGITGLMFINLDFRQPEAPDLSPPIHFVSEYPVIPSQPSEIKRLLAGLEEIVNKLKDIDTVGISNHLKGAAGEIENFLKGKDIQAILKNAEATTANLRDFTGRLTKAGLTEELGKSLKEAREALTAAKALFASTQQELTALRLPEIGLKTQDTLTQVNMIAEKLRRSSDSLDMLMERLYERPPDLFFGKPPKGRWNE
jgi:phospholipid/cholesterol/gamma-HCH transport system substrate-binding protein